MRKPLMRPAYAAVLCLALLFGGLVLDLTTTQGLVVAIIYNIPIALSGLALSRSLTLWTIVLALTANVAAGYENAILLQGYDAVTLLNRALAALSFILVGVMTLALDRASDEVTALADKEAEAERERRLRGLIVTLSSARTPETLLTRAVTLLRALLEADAVVVAALEGDHFTTPRYAEPADAGVAKPGSLASWAVDAIPATDTPVITVRSERGVMTVGRWRRPRAKDGDENGGKGDFIVIATRPRARDASLLLGEALRGLEPLLSRAEPTAPVLDGALEEPSEMERRS